MSVVRVGLSQREPWQPWRMTYADKSIHRSIHIPLAGRGYPEGERRRESEGVGEREWERERGRGREREREREGGERERTDSDGESKKKGNSDG